MRARFTVEGEGFRKSVDVTASPKAVETLQRFLEDVAAGVVVAQDEVARARGEPLPSAKLIAAEAERMAPVRRAVVEGESPRPRRRSSLPPVQLPAGFAMPAMPGWITHRSARRPFELGVLAGITGGAQSCPYGDSGLQVVCGRAWAEGLRLGEKLRAAGPAQPVTA